MSSRADSGFDDALTVCPFCSCGCGLHVQAAGGALSGVVPSATHPVSRGRLCVRGWAAHEASRWGARLLFPQVRERGTLRRVSWDEALNAAVLKLNRLRDDGRPLGVLGSGRASNEANFLAVALARSAFRTGTIDAGLRGCYESLLPAGASAAGQLDPAALERLEHADVVLVMEGDLARSHPRVATGVLRALQRGGRMVTAGWHRTELSRLAAVHLTLGAAAPLDALRALRVARGAAASAGRPAQTPVASDANGVEAAAALLAHAQRAAFVVTPFDGDLNLLRSCADLIGGIAADMVAAGGDAPCILPLPVRTNSRGALEMGASPNALPGGYPLDDAPARARLRALWGGAPCWSAGHPADEMITKVDGLVVLADDPAEYAASPSRTGDVLQALDTLVVLDSFATPAAEAAHVVLPIAAFGEDAGSVTSQDGRVQRWNACVPASGEARAGWRVMRDLLAGLGAPFAPASLDDVSRAIQQAVPQYAPCGPEAVARNGGVLLAPREDAAPVAHSAQGHPGGERAPAPEAAPSGPAGWLLRRAGAFDWNADHQVMASPTLRRSPAAELRLHPDGLVTMNTDDAGQFGLREGWRVHIRSARGAADVAVTLRPDQERRALFVPYAHRDRLAAVTGESTVVEVEVSLA